MEILSSDSAFGLTQKLLKAGYSPEDVGEIGVLTDSSNMLHAIIGSLESSKGIIKTSVSKAGMSSWINPTPADSTDTVVVAVGADETITTEGITHDSGDVFNGTLSNTYIKPGTVSIAAIDSAIVVEDDGLGNLIYMDSQRDKIGTIDYATGAVEVQYHAMRSARSTSEPQVRYKHSKVPMSVNVPVIVRLRQLVVITSSAQDITATVMNNEPGNAENPSPYNMPAVVNKTATPVQLPSADFAAVIDLAEAVSICTSLDMAKRNKRWIELARGGSTTIKAVHLHWELVER